MQIKGENNYADDSSVAGIIAGFAFPLFFISAVRSKDEENEVMTYTFLSCLTFGICMLSILATLIYF